MAEYKEIPETPENEQEVATLPEVPTDEIGEQVLDIVEEPEAKEE